MLFNDFFYILNFIICKINRFILTNYIQQLLFMYNMLFTINATNICIIQKHNDRND